MKPVHDSDDINKAFYKMENGSSMHIVAEDIQDFSETFVESPEKHSEIPQSFSCITCKKTFPTQELAEKHILTCKNCIYNKAERYFLMLKEYENKLYSTK